MAVRISWAAFDAGAAYEQQAGGVTTAVRIGWATFDAKAPTASVRVAWAVLDVGATKLPPPYVPAPKPKLPGGSVAGYHREYSTQQYEIPVQVGADTTAAEEEEIILALLMEIATHVV